MRNYQALLATLLCIPSQAVADTLPASIITQLQSLAQSAIAQLNSGPPKANPSFNAQKQHIDVTGIHAWQAPGPSDERGPCPGLNALANHGYLPRNGFATVFDLVSANTQVYGMGLDLATILSAYGAGFDGPGIGWSIGGEIHTGISGSHNNYESDSSPCRGDLNQYGNNEDLVLSLFKELYNLQPDAATANYDINVIGQHRDNRFKQSIAGNPNFYYGPFSGTAVSHAAHSFIFRLMANHSTAYPAGILDQEVLKSFFAISGKDANSFEWTPGFERIPENWYRRAIDDDYGLDGLSYDIAGFFAKYPEMSGPGCNTGTTNNFTYFDLDDDNAGDYDFKDPKNIFCYGIAEAVDAAKPNLGSSADVVEELLVPIQNALGCKTVPKFNQTVQQACPGYSFYGGPTGPVAPGAVRD